MKGVVKNVTLRSKIILFTLVLTLFIVAIFSVSYYQNLATDLEKNLTDYANSLSNQVGQYFNERLNIFVVNIFSLTKSDRFQQTFLRYLTNDIPYQYSLTLSDFNSLLSEVKIPDSFYESAYLYTPKRTFFDLSRITYDITDFTESELYRDYLNADVHSIYYGHQMKDDVYKSGKSIVPIVIRTPIAGYPNDVFLIVHIDSQVIEDYLSNSVISGVDILVVDSNNQLVASGNSQMNDRYISIISNQNELHYGIGKNYIISETKLAVNDWKIISFSDKTIIKKSLENSVAFLIFLHIITLLIAGFFSSFFSGQIVKPLQDLQKSMFRFFEGDFSPWDEHYPDNEVGRLASGFSEMGRQLSDLVRELQHSVEQLQIEKENVYQEKTLKRFAELSALQAQIDPHFLYNTLNSIVWLSMEKENEKINDLAVNLSAFYKYRIQEHGIFVSIRNEIEEVDHYVNIQNFRYSNTINCQFDIDEMLIEKFTLKMIVQPLVENAIFHGLCCKEGARDIMVRGKLMTEKVSNGDFCIEVIDNGAGMPPKKLETINNDLQESKMPLTGGYGIYNVNERIQLIFGKKYGLQYESELGVGTTARLILPQITEQESKILCIR